MRGLRDWLQETHSAGFELRRHFFLRFFDSDLVSTPGQWQVVAGGVLAVLLSLSIILTQAYYHKYQELNLLNSPELHEKITSRQGVARQLADSPRKPEEIVAEVYLGALARFPTPEEERLMRKHRGDRLPDWMNQVQADPLPAFHSLITGLRRDLAAVTAGLTLHWSSGPVEGNVNRVILWNQICQVTCLCSTLR